MVPADTDVSTEALRALGFETADTPGPLGPPPTTVTMRESVETLHRTGASEVQGGRMGPWLFMRARFGPRGGYTSGSCDLTHWGLVLEGEVAIQRSDITELASRGHVYYVEPGHRFTSPDGATIADYTPVASLENARTASWRRAAIRTALEPREAVRPLASATATVARRRRLVLRTASTLT
ncbi:MAG: hypothetical protein LH650_06210 [Chloroflexi bacterium]|nr:hypothetical protein [Chloroflexota bacterium]